MAAVYVDVSALVLGVPIVLAMRHNQEPKRALAFAPAICTSETVLFSPHYPW